MELWGEIFTLEEKRKEELDNKCAEWREVEPLLNEGLDAVNHIKSISIMLNLLIYKEVKKIKDKYK